MEYRKTVFIISIISIGFITGALSHYFFSGGFVSGIGACQGVCNVTQETKVIYANNSESSFSRLFQEVKNSTVSIEVEKSRGLKSGDSQGSGWVYDKEGHIITNHHVIENAEEITVRFLGGEVLSAHLTGTDPYSDLAVLKLDSKKEIEPLEVGDSDKIKIGNPIAAVGNPYGLSGSMSKGIVSQKGRLLSGVEGFSIADVIQIDAAVNPGNSGGPLLNSQGKVVGVNTAIKSSTGSFTGIGFAIPSNTVKRVAESIIKAGEYEHPWIGIEGRDVTPEIADAMNMSIKRGFLIITVKEDSPAEEVGLKGGKNNITIEGRSLKIGGDVIVSMEGKKVRNVNDILNYLGGSTDVGEEISLTILRDNEERKVDLTLGERPEVSK